MSDITRFTGEPCFMCGGSGKTWNGAWLRHKRESKGVSLLEMSKRMGFSSSYISDVERGNRRCTKMIAAMYERL